MEKPTNGQEVRRRARDEARDLLLEGMRKATRKRGRTTPAMLEALNDAARTIMGIF